MEKILIWFEKKSLKPEGGPAGYLYNLNSFIEKRNITNISYKPKFKKIGKLKKKLKRYFYKKICNKQNYNKKELLMSLKVYEKINEEKLENFKLVHFHDTKELFKNNDKIRGIKILTSHSPQLRSLEELETLYDKETLEKEKKFIEEYKKYDYIAFEKADYIIFPCVEAMEPYEKDIVVKKILKKKLNEKRIKFLLTGIEYKEIQRDEEYFYKKYNIPKGSIVVTYIGRHNEIKGYDILVKAGKILLEKYENLYFIIAGKENEKIEKISHPRWKEIGWTKEGFNLMKNCDLFILPNRETYFDLIFLELLSQNTTILCSETGGNKYFKKYNSEKINFFESENIDSLVFQFEKLYSNLKELKENNSNEKIYFENFTLDIFGENYLKIIEEIIKENKSAKI